jgi:hypothetical protein
MATVTVAAFLLQAPSAKSKVYGSAVWIDPGTGDARMFSAYGSATTLRNGVLQTLDDQRPNQQKYLPTPTTASGATAAFDARYEQKANASSYDPSKLDYDVVLGGPTTVAVDEAALADPKATFKKFFRDHVNGTPTAGTPSEVAGRALTGRPATAPTVTPPATAANRPIAPRSTAAGIVLANGGTYYPRSVGGMLDVDVLRTARNDLKTHLALTGPSGTGKSTLPEAAFGADSVLVHQFHGDSRVADIVGQWVPAEPADNAPSGFVFRKGSLTRAMEDGLVWVADELSRAPSEVVSVLLAAMDFRRTITIDALPGHTVTANDGFMVCGTYNPDGVDVKPLDPALIRRFGLKIEVGNDYDAVARRGVGTQLIKVAKNLATANARAVANGEFGNWAPSAALLLDLQNMNDAGMGDEIVTGALMSHVPDEDRDLVTDVVGTVYGFTPTALALGMSA